MFKLNTVLKIVSLLCNNCLQETDNKVRSILSLCSDVAPARALTLSKELNKLKRAGGDRCTEPLRFKQKMAVISEDNNKCNQPKMETTTSDNYYTNKVVLVISMQYSNQ